MDVMCTGIYPNDPLPGPRKRDAINDLIAIADKLMEDYRNFPVCCWPKNPIIEPPMYFPGANWSGRAVYV